MSRLDKLKFKKILAIDYGRKFTGLATYKVGVDPYPLMYGRLAYTSDQKLIEDIYEITEEEFVDILVIGIPYFTDGTASTMTRTIQEFVTLAESQLVLPIHTVDETLTSFEAQERMKSDPRFNFQVDLTKIDALSATIILEEFLKNFSN